MAVASIGRRVVCVMSSKEAYKGVVYRWYSLVERVCVGGIV